ncbi:PIN domain-containing protein [Nonomuraea sp. NPDC046570]|uniref:PIN domain-containing protein n=1 Tax=Nonomuraea sp. NPDC046570 TaxID=3155255 RepID=UPI0033D9395E
MIVLDTSALLAAYDRSQPEHEAVMRVLRTRSDEPLLLSPFVLAELDYLLCRRVGVDAELTALQDVSDGVYMLMPFEQAAITDAVRLIDKYRSFDIGLADASVVVAAGRSRTTQVLTLDQRHFRAMKPLWGTRSPCCPPTRLEVGTLGGVSGRWGCPPGWRPRW